MDNPSDTALVRQELANLDLREASVLKELDDIAAEKQRLQSALSVLQAVRAKHGILVADSATASQASSASADAPTADTGVGPKRRRSGHAEADKAATVESLLCEAVATAGPSGATSATIFGTVKKWRHVTDNTLTSTLSRLVGKKLVRRDGRLYFPTATH